MLAEQTIERLRALRLRGLAQQYQDQLARGDVSQLSFDDRFGLLVEEEWNRRLERRTHRRLSKAELKQSACVEDIECSSARGLEAEVVRELASCRWIRAKRNLLVTGSTGTGKTWIACALSQAACRAGFTALYTRIPRLLHELALARLDGSYLKQLAQLAKVDLLVLDDIGLCPMENEAQQALLEIMDDRFGHRATLVTSQLPVEKWYATFSDPNVADALLDRLMGESQQLRLKGPSRRPNRPAEPKSNQKGNGE